MTGNSHILKEWRSYLRRVLIPLLAVPVFAVSSCTSGDDDQQPGISGTLFFNAGENFDNKIIDVYYYYPQGDLSKMGFQFIMPGDSRNGEEHLQPWIEKADEYRLILIAPEFDSDYFTTRKYNEGNIINDIGGFSPPEKTTFYLIDRIFEFVQQELGLSSETYNIYGHSAGAEFVHRFVQFYDSPYAARAVAANSGWYTFADETLYFPYGVNLYCGDISRFRARIHGKKLSLLLGTADTLRTSSLRITPETDAQGLNRFERGNNFFDTNQQWAAGSGHLFRWHLQYVQDAGHSYAPMSKAAADHLYGGR